MSSPVRHPLEPDAQRLLDARLGRWQQRRAALYCLVVMALFPLFTVSELETLFTGGELSRLDLWGTVVAWTIAAGYGAASWMFRRMAPVPRRVARRFGWMMMAAGATCILVTMLVLVNDASVWGPDFTPQIRTATVAIVAMLMVLVVHSVGSLFVALPPWYALWPLLPLWTLFGAFLLGLEGPLWYRWIWVAAFPVVGVPGFVWSVWRHERWVDRFKIEALGGSYDALRRDLVEARRLHELLFPQPIVDGPVRVTFAYEPMRDVGGDFLFARRFEGGRVLVVVVDVTGHGVASALAVTRIHAVLTAIAAPIAAGETDVPAPGALIARLNAFIQESLAPQGVFATAIACLVDPSRDTVRWSNAGHPPGLLRRVDGTIVELDSTCTMLGVLPAAEFDSAEQITAFAPTEVMVLCTDGVIEAEGERHVQFGIEGLRRVVSAHHGGIGAMAMQAVRGHRPGAASDDILVVEVGRVA